MPVSPINWERAEVKCLCAVSSSRLRGEREDEEEREEKRVRWMYVKGLLHTVIVEGEGDGILSGSTWLKNAGRKMMKNEFDNYIGIKTIEGGRDWLI